MEGIVEMWDTLHREPVSLLTSRSNRVRPGADFLFEDWHVLDNGERVPKVRMMINASPGTDFVAVVAVQDFDVVEILSATLLERSPLITVLEGDDVEGSDSFILEDDEDSAVLAVFFISSAVTDNSSLMEWFVERTNGDVIDFVEDFLEYVHNALYQPGVEMYLYEAFLESFMEEVG